MTETQSQKAVKDEILRILMLQKYTTRYYLRQELMNAGFVLFDRKVRSTIESMITDDGYCIQSSDKGYSLITTLDELNEAVAYLEAKSKSIAIRKNCLSRNYASGKLEAQMSLFESDKVVN